MKWTDELKDELQRRLMVGQSAGAIAAAMGVTRNVIMGKKHRMKPVDAPKPEPLWNPQMDQVLRDGLELGLRWTELGRLMNLKRDQCRKRAQVLKIAVPRMAPGLRAGDRPANRIRVAPSSPVLKPLPMPTPEPMPANPIPFMMTRTDQCRWPVEDAMTPGHSMMLCCGGVTPEGQPYCVRHRRMAGHPPASKPSAPFERTVMKCA